MRGMTLAALALGLAACGPKPAEQSETAPATFPTPNAAYEAHYKVADAKSGAARELTIFADKTRMRVEGALPGATITTATIADPASGKVITFRTGAGAPKVAMTLSRDQLGAAAELFEAGKARAGASVVGAETVAGERCRLWKSPSAVAGEPAQLTCVTDDGVLLRSARENDPATSQMEAVSLKRGAQDPALFAVPEGYETVDYGPCLVLTQDAMAAMREGKRPDMAKMKECQALGEKLGGVFGP